MFVLPLFCSIKDYIDFKSKPTEGPQEPLCDPEIPSEVMVDHLPGLIYRDKLDYVPESGLRMVSLNLLKVPKSLYVIQKSPQKLW